MEDDLAERAGRLLAAVVNPPATVILFGSRARGQAAPGSDLDILVIERRFESRRAERVRLRGALRGLGVPIDLLLVDEAQVEEWGDVRGTVLAAALREGRVLAEA